MNRTRAADDFEAIRLRLEELRRERQQQQRSSAAGAADDPAAEPDAVAHVPRHIVKRYLAARVTRPSGGPR